MRTRNADKPKPAPVAKSTPAARKSAVKTPQKPPEISAESSATPKSSGTKRTRAIQAKNKEIQDVPTSQPAGKFHFCFEFEHLLLFFQIYCRC